MRSRFGPRQPFVLNLKRYSSRVLFGQDFRPFRRGRTCKAPRAEYDGVLRNPVREMAAVERHRLEGQATKNDGLSYKVECTCCLEDLAGASHG